MNGLRGRKGREPRTKGTQSPLDRFYPLSKEVENVIRKLGDSFNFGLYFNKWLWVSKESFKCNFQSESLAGEVIRKYESLKANLSNYIKKYHLEVQDACLSFESIGYKCKAFEVVLKSPLIIGLGNAHPTERGFTFHWTLGIPYIPAESIKGVVRLAYLVERALEDDSFFASWASKDQDFWSYLARPFGREEKDGKGAERGKVVFLDALPVDVPHLTLEITTCHYTDYYSERRGPTEDQSPNPLPFLAVAPGARYKFTYLVHGEISQDEQEVLDRVFMTAISEYGIGAKTALGHGRFKKE